MKVKCEIDWQRKLWTARLQAPIEPMMRALQLKYRPQAGDAWKVNLFRVSGAEPEREYLAWQPTFTPQPDFHVPSAFGNLLLVE
jgi:alpha-galactosidase